MKVEELIMGLNSVAIKLIKKYQETKNQTIGSGRCKHYPSCSNYSIECYQKFNFVKASFLSFFRIIRCNPLTKKVYDPVPLTKQEKKALKEKYNSLLYIVPVINEYITLNPNKEIFEYILFIYNYTFKDEVTDELITLYYEYLHIFKNETKKKNININYKLLSKELDIYLSKPFERLI
jgi:putative membrane protein insertion efficiency factor